MSQRSLKRLLVTGGAGFIGSAFIRYLIDQVPTIEKIVNLDLLTYAGSLENLIEIKEDPRHHFVQGNILDRPLVEELIKAHDIEAVVHFAAETHVDRSIDNPQLFYQTNVEGTIALLDLVRQNRQIHFHHISTDEVFGSTKTGAFTESSPYHPNSPYAASKAGSDHFVRAYASTYGLSVTLSHSSNNYGPCQHPEKFIPRMISRCIKGESLEIYGEGVNVRDWLYVDDHAEAIWRILRGGSSSQSYNVGGRCEMRNIDLLHLLLEKIAKVKQTSVDQLTPLITFVDDRPGHDFRYALNCDKLERDLGWTPRSSFDGGLEKTVRWYLDEK